MPHRVDRRRFLQAAAACGTVASIDRWSLTVRAADAAELVAGKDSRLIVHSTKTLELETPLELLREYPLTPKKVLFVRNNQELADTRTTKPLKMDDWQFEIVGLVEYPRTVALERLREMEQTEVEMVLQCSGNGRAHFGRAAAVKGSAWN